VTQRNSLIHHRHRDPLRLMRARTVAYVAIDSRYTQDNGGFQ
jgi:hypothetical protein